MTNCREIQALISGHLDGELSANERKTLDDHLACCEACRKEFEAMAKLVSASDTLRVEAPPEEVWDTFMEGVYNRMERQTGWIVFVCGLAVLTLFGIYQFVVNPWGPALVKLMVAAPVVGLGVLFVSVLRQRLFVAKTDRYSREVQR